MGSELGAIWGGRGGGGDLEGVVGSDDATDSGGSSRSAKSGTPGGPAPHLERSSQRVKNMGKSSTLQSNCSAEAASAAKQFVACAAHQPNSTISKFRWRCVDRTWLCVVYITAGTARATLASWRSVAWCRLHPGGAECGCRRTHAIPAYNPPPGLHAPMRIHQSGMPCGVPRWFVLHLALFMLTPSLRWQPQCMAETHAGPQGYPPPVAPHCKGIPVCS